MAYVITDACIDLKDQSCVQECPVDCIKSDEESKQYFIDPDNSFATSQPSYNLFDARVAFTPRAGRTEIFVQGTNLTDEAIVANGVTSGPNGSQIVTFKPPRMWVAGVHFRF